MMKHVTLTLLIFLPGCLPGGFTPAVLDDGSGTKDGATGTLTEMEPTMGGSASTSGGSGGPCDEEPVCGTGEDVVSCPEQCNVCGDGVVFGDEDCDDGNEMDGDGCEVDCTPTPPPMCGNGDVENGEECDDANVADDDACLNNCQDAECGDGVVWAGMGMLFIPSLNI